MIPPSEVLQFFTLYCSANILNNLENYEPAYVESSSYYFKNSSDLKSTARAVRYDHVFDSITFFPKCCPPHSVYDTVHKNCVESNASAIYEEFKIHTDFIRNGLSHCEVVGQRIIERKTFMHRQPKNGRMKLLSDKSQSAEGKFCLDKTNQANLLVMKFCEERKFCEGSSNVDWCLGKCCWDGYNYKGRHCVYTSQVGLSVDRFEARYEGDDKYAFLYGVTDCYNQRLYELSELDFVIDKNGSLIRRDNNRRYELNEYCLDSIARTDSNEHTDLVVLCESKDAIDIRLAAIVLLVVLICACFIIGLLKSVLIYELNEWVTKIAACYCFVEIIFWILTVMRLNGINFRSYCKVFGYVHVLISVSRLTWFSVLSYEVSRIMGKTRVNICQRNELFRFLCYFLYGVTVPGIAMVVFIMAHRQIYPLPNIFIPRIDIITCVTRLRSYGAIYILIAIVPLIFINALLYGKILCCRYPKKTEKDQMIYNIYSFGGESNMVKSKKTGFLLLKLAIINIITWIYYWSEYSNIMEGNIVLDNVGKIMPH